MDNKKIEEWYLNLKIPGEPDEFEVKALLALFDIEVPKGQRFEPEDDISVSDFHAPFVLKACSSDLLHKTDIGGVVLNVDEKSLIETANKLRAKFPVKSLLIEELVKPESIEFIVGALVDPNFGPAVMVGTGGIFTELYKDVAFRLIPCSQSEIFRMLDELTVSQVFKGFRGSELNREGFVDMVESVCNLVTHLGKGFNQLDINPVVYSGGRWLALDAKMILGEKPQW